MRALYNGAMRCHEDSRAVGARQGTTFEMGRKPGCTTKINREVQYETFEVVYTQALCVVQYRRGDASVERRKTARLETAVA